MTKRRTTLAVLDARVEARAAATRAAHPSWPCAEGCDHCCRSLPSLPLVSEPEYDRLALAIDALPPEESAGVLARLRETPSGGPLVCPMLATESGACMVYDARPVACRSYGFYTERDAALCCSKVLDAVASFTDEGSPPVIWGNGQALADDLSALGGARSLRAWLAERPPRCASRRGG